MGDDNCALRGLALGVAMLGVLGSACSDQGDSSQSEAIGSSAEALVAAGPDIPLQAGFEPVVAVNPTNPNNIVVGQFRSLRISNDGGSTFPSTVDAVLPPTHAGGGGDPAIAFDSQGTLFFSFLAIRIATGGTDVFVQRVDTLNGVPLGTAVNVTGQLGVGAPSFFPDKSWIAVDAFAGSPFQDRVYLVWSDLTISQVRATSSPDGLTWSPPVTVSSTNDCAGFPIPANAVCFPWPPHVAAAANGDVYVSYRTGVANNALVDYIAGQHIVLARSDDGGASYTFSTTPFAANITGNAETRLLDRNFSWTLGAGQAWVLPNPAAADSLALVFNDDPTDGNDGPGFDDADVLIMRSADRGATWSAPQRVDSAPTGSLQLFPTATWSTDPACLAVAWYDARQGFVDPVNNTNALGNFLLDLVVRTSADGGQSFGPEAFVNDVAFDPDLNAGDRLGGTGSRPANRIGEYNGVVAARGVVWTGQDPTVANPGQRILFDLSDRVPPSFTSVPADITTSNCGSINLGVPTAVDQCGAGPVSITNDAPAEFSPGTTLVTWTATDAAGNTTTAVQRVTLVLGDDPACCPAGTNVILGTSNNDVLNGTDGPDCILGRGAQDTINGLGGDDFISSGDGNDSIAAGSGNDVVFAGSGQDSIVGGSGADNLSGGDGDDNVQGGTENDTLSGGQGQDQLFGQQGDDRLFGDDGDDNLQGGDGNDSLVGGVNNDVCNGGTGTNTFAQCEFGAPNSCADSVRNGTESDVDCGGACPDCAAGSGCSSGTDCQSGLCTDGICQGSGGGAGEVTTELTFSTDWGGGYCAVLNVTNNTAAPTTSFSVSLDTNASSIYTSWNGNFSGSSGVVSVMPGFDWNSSVDPGETDRSIGFCANRTVPGSGTLPFIIGTTGTF